MTSPDAQARLKRQLRDLAIALHDEHYPEVTQWEPLDDEIGIMNQIDNMTTGLSRTPDAQPSSTEGEVERLREALTIAVTALGRVNVRAFDRKSSPLKPLGDIAREALSDIMRAIGDDAYDAIAAMATKP